VANFPGVSRKRGSQKITKSVHSIYSQAGPPALNMECTTIAMEMSGEV
jgi:hypothetical protein